MKHLFAEFKRRNVFRVAALYLVSAWLTAQVADVVIGLGEFPPAIGRTVLILLALGFPVALVASWVFQWTPEGLRRESESAEAAPADPSASRRVDYIIISLLSVALIYFIVNHDWQGPQGVSGASIAVLPFEHRSAQPDDLYFTDGIHEDILTQLGKISSMMVISRTSVMQYRGSVKTIPEIAAELGVATILEGGVQRAGNRVRINMQLIDAGNDRHLWAETYDRELSADNVFAIQSEIAASIAAALHARLLPQELARIETVPTHNLEAYDAYLLGRRQLAKRQEEELAKGRAFFIRAIELDPAFALAHAGLSNASALLAEIGEPGRFNREELLAEAEEAAHKALELDANLGEAHTALGVVKRFMGVAPGEYAPYLARGVELAPGSADARKWYSNYLGESGQEEAALEQLEKAVQLDPLSPIVRVNLAGTLEKLGRREQAQAQITRALDIDPEFRPALFALWGFGEIEVALKYVSRAYEKRKTDPWIMVDFVLNYLTLGDPARAANWAAEIERVAPTSIPFMIARLNLSLYRWQDDAMQEWAERLVKYEQGVTVPSRVLLLLDLRAGDPGTALARYEEKYPGVLVPDPEVSDNYQVAIDVAMLFQAMGEQDRADMLLERSLQYLAAQPPDQIAEVGIFAARAHALKRNNEEAITTLRRTVDAGWSRHWWFFLKQDPAFDAIRNDARFDAILEEMEAQMARRLEVARQLEADGEIASPTTP